MSRRELTVVGLALLALAAAIYAINYAIFQKPDDLFFYILIDLAFLPLEVLVLALIVDRLLAQRERQARQNKMNMVIGMFFSATGRQLLSLLGDMVVDGREALARLAVAPDWTEGQLGAAADSLSEARFTLVASPENLQPLHDFLVTQREFLVRLLENPVLLEHETFTDLLWAVFHLEEELSARTSLADLPAADLQHLAGDSHRAYGQLLRQWLAYMLHLRRTYPFLFSFEARTNPLRRGATAEITAC